MEQQQQQLRPPEKAFDVLELNTSPGTEQMYRSMPPGRRVTISLEQFLQSPPSAGAGVGVGVGHGPADVPCDGGDADRDARLARRQYDASAAQPQVVRQRRARRLSDYDDDDGDDDETWRRSRARDSGGWRRAFLLGLFLASMVFGYFSVFIVVDGDGGGVGGGDYDAALRVHQYALSILMLLVPLLCQGLKSISAGG